MKNINISYLRNNLSAILAKLSSLGAVTVMDRDTPVAIIYPAKENPSESGILRLKKSGILVSKQSKALDIKGFLSEPAASILKKGASALKSLLEERRSGW